jgi:hypothetical protein
VTLRAPLPRGHRQERQERDRRVAASAVEVLVGIGERNAAELRAGNAADRSTVNIFRGDRRSPGLAARISGRVSGRRLIGVVGRLTLIAGRSPRRIGTQVFAGRTQTTNSRPLGVNPPDPLPVVRRGLAAPAGLHALGRGAVARVDTAGPHADTRLTPHKGRKLPVAEPDAHCIAAGEHREIRNAVTAIRSHVLGGPKRDTTPIGFGDRVTDRRHCPLELRSSYLGDGHTRCIGSPRRPYAATGCGPSPLCVPRAGARKGVRSRHSCGTVPCPAEPELAAHGPEHVVLTR